MELRDYLKIIKRRKLSFFLVIVLVFSCYSLITLLRPKLYTATGSIMLREPTMEERIYASLSGIGATRVTVDTQLRMMGSSIFVEEVVKEIKELFELTLLHHEVRNSYKIYLSGDRVINIEVKHADRNKVLKILNGIINVAIRKNRELSAREYTSAVNYITTQLNNYRDRLAEVEEELIYFKRKEGIVDLNIELENNLSRLIDYQTRKEQTILHQRRNEMLLTQLKNSLRNVPEFKTIKGIIPNPEVEEYKKQLISLQLQLLDLERSYTKEHPKIISINAKIRNIKNRIETQIAKYIEVDQTTANPTYQYLLNQYLSVQMNQIGMEVEEKALEQFIKRTEESLKNLSEKEAQYSKILREKQTVERLLHSLEEMLEQTRISEVMKQGNAEVLERPTHVIPLRRADPMMFLFVGIISLVCALATAVVMEFLDDTIRTTHQVKRYLNVSVLGTIPYIEEADQRSISNLSFKSLLSDIYHRICYQLEGLIQKENIKSIVISSPKHGEGKTTVAYNLAVAQIREGRRVILVDGDLRRPNVHRLLGLDNTIGLTSILSGEIAAKHTLREIKGELVEKLPFDKMVLPALQHTEIEGLRVLSAGPIVPHPIGLLKSEYTTKLVEVLEKEADIIIFDSSPVNMVVDALIIASYLDGIIIVLDATSSKKRDAIHSKHVLTTRGVKVLGCILNNLAMEEDHYYYYYYYTHTGERGKRRKRRAS